MFNISYVTEKSKEFWLSIDKHTTQEGLDMKRNGFKMALISTQVDEEAQYFYRKLGYKECGSLILNDCPLNNQWKCLWEKYCKISICKVIVVSYYVYDNYCNIVETDHLILLKGVTMNIVYSSNKSYTQEQLQKLFHSVGWLSGNYPERVFRALNNSETVFTAWKGQELVGLVNVIDDGELTAYLHYLLVNPLYQGYGIGKELLKEVRKKYSKYLYLILIAENETLVEFYKREGFDVVENTVVMAITKK